MVTSIWRTIQEKRIDRARMFSTYVVLYANDMACTCINDIWSCASDMDKEDMKKYKAVARRVKMYQSSMCEILKDTVYFLADYYSFVDRVNDDDLDILYDAVNKAITKEYGEKKPFLCKIEVARLMSRLAIRIMDDVLYLLDKAGIDTCSLPSYRFTQPTNILDDLAKWQCIKLRKDKIIEIDDTIKALVEKIKLNIACASTFDGAYDFAVKQEEDGKKK